MSRLFHIFNYRSLKETLKLYIVQLGFLQTFITLPRASSAAQNQRTSWHFVHFSVISKLLQFITAMTTPFWSVACFSSASWALNSCCKNFFNLFNHNVTIQISFDKFHIHTYGKKDCGKQLLYTNRIYYHLKHVHKHNTIHQGFP